MAAGLGADVAGILHEVEAAAASPDIPTPLMDLCDELQAFLCTHTAFYVLLQPQGPRLVEPAPASLP